MKVLAVALALTFVACGGAQRTVAKKSSMQVEYEGAPEWVKSRSCNKKVKEELPETAGQLCGVGMHHIRGPQLMNLAQRAALGEATAAIAMILGGKVKTLTKKYEGEFNQGTTNEASDSDGKTGNVTVNWAKMALPGVRSVATWISGMDNLYVLAVHDKVIAAEALKGASELSAGQKKVISNHEEEFLKLLDTVEVETPQAGTPE